MANDVWILGIHMTKFGRHGDKDALDLACEAALGALDDAGVASADMGVMACGTLFNAAAGMGQQVLKQIGQTGIPVYNVTNACATGATAIRSVYLAIKAGEAELGLAVGVEQMGKMGLLGASGTAAGGRKEFAPSGRNGAVMATEGYLGTGTMPGVFAQAGMDDLVSQHHADVLAEHRRGGRRGAGERGASTGPAPRSSTPGREDLRVGADHRPLGGIGRGPAGCQHLHSQRRGEGV
jgi:acetyl-CoA acetyltransferase